MHPGPGLPGPPRRSPCCRSWRLGRAGDQRTTVHAGSHAAPRFGAGYPGPARAPPSDGRVPEGPRPDHRGLMRVFRTKQPVINPDRKAALWAWRRWSRTSSSRGDAAVLNAGSSGSAGCPSPRRTGCGWWSWPSRGGRLRPRRDGGRSWTGTPARRAILCVTHCETSTGALHDLEGNRRRLPRGGKLVLADVITTLGIHPVEFDAWGLLGRWPGPRRGSCSARARLRRPLGDGVGTDQAGGLSRFYLDLGGPGPRSTRTRPLHAGDPASCSRWRRRSGSWRRKGWTPSMRATRVTPRRAGPWCGPWSWISSRRPPPTG